MNYHCGQRWERMITKFQTKWTILSTNLLWRPGGPWNIFEIKPFFNFQFAPFPKTQVVQGQVEWNWFVPGSTLTGAKFFQSKERIKSWSCIKTKTNNSSNLGQFKWCLDAWCKVNVKPILCNLWSFGYFRSRYHFLRKHCQRHNGPRVLTL